MITIQEIFKQLNETLQPKPFADYCVNGIQVKGCDQVTKIATGVSASLATIKAAAEYGAQVLFVHHGLFWKGDSQVVDGAVKEKLKVLLKNDMTLIAYHLPLDAHQDLGNNWLAAKEMGWSDLQQFGIYNGSYIGVKGRVPRQSRDSFKQALETYYSHQAFTALGGPQEIETVALISGGAYKSIQEAAAEGIDCFVTGNFDEPAWHLAHENNINFYALGHSATEKIGPRAIGHYLKNKFPQLECRFIDIENPF